MLEKKQIKFLEAIPKACIHGKNILAKKEKDKIELFYEKYHAFYTSITKLKNDDIEKKSNLFIEYKNDIHNLNKENKEDSKSSFSAQSKLEPTVVEEFLFHLFKDVINNSSIIRVGSVKAYNNLYFSPINLINFEKNNFIKINEKDQDFAIYKTVILKDNHEKYKLSIPVVSIECKTYLDKTMLEGSIATAEKIKSGNPHCKFYIVTETYEVDLKVDPSTSRIDNVFVLKKGNKKSERNQSIESDVINKLYLQVKNHLDANWVDIEKNIKEKGTIY